MKNLKLISVATHNWPIVPVLQADDLKCKLRSPFWKRHYLGDHTPSSWRTAVQRAAINLRDQTRCMGSAVLMKLLVVFVTANALAGTPPVAYTQVSSLPRAWVRNQRLLLSGL